MYSKKYYMEQAKFVSGEIVKLSERVKDCIDYGAFPIYLKDLKTYIENIQYVEVAYNTLNSLELEKEFNKRLKKNKRNKK